MFVHQLRTNLSAAPRAAASRAATGATASSVAGALTPSTWSAAAELLAHDSAPTTQVRALAAAKHAPRAVSAAIIEKCATLQRYSDDAIAAAFPALCDAMREQKVEPTIAIDALQRSMSRGAYIDSRAFGPLLRLINDTHPRPLSEVLMQWAWMSHTRAAGDPVARTAVLAAYARAQQTRQALEEEEAMRKDGVQLREEGLVALLAALPGSKWSSAMSTVKYWREEFDAASGASSSGGSAAENPFEGRPGIEAAVELAALAARAQRHVQARSALSAVVAEDGPDCVTQLDVDRLCTAFESILPSCSSKALKGASDKEIDLLKALLLTGKANVDAAATLEPSLCRLLGLMACSAALLKNRDQLLEVGAALRAVNATQADFDATLMSLVGPLRGEAWQVGKLAVAELAKATGFTPAVEVISRLMVLHQAVEEDKGAVLDAFLGAEATPASV
jgi:hypothetical protein